MDYESLLDNVVTTHSVQYQRDMNTKSLHQVVRSWVNKDRGMYFATIVGCQAENS